MTTTPPQQLLQRLDDIGTSIASTNKALALIGLGSVGVELDRLDEYSDLDFFVVVKDGHKAEFITNFDWLSRARPLIFAFKNTPDGYKILFDDDLYAEFAVFELRELETATYTAGRIVWKDNAFEEQWRIPKKQPVAWKPESREWLIGEIVTCLYVRLGRYRRGEQRHPEWPAHLSRFLAGYDRVVESAQEMLAYLDENYTVQPEIKRVITQLSTTARSELF